MAVRITLEYGHASMVRSHLTPEGYTHDWEVFVRGVDNADIHQYIEKGILFVSLTLTTGRVLLRSLEEIAISIFSFSLVLSYLLYPLCYL